MNESATVGKTLSIKRIASFTPTFHYKFYNPNRKFLALSQNEINQGRYKWRTNSRFYVEIHDK